MDVPPVGGGTHQLDQPVAEKDVGILKPEAMAETRMRMAAQRKCEMMEEQIRKHM